MDLLAPYHDLPNARRGEFFIAEGRWVVEALLASAHEVQSVVMAEGLGEEPDVPGGVPVVRLARDEISALAGFEFHHGFLACARRPDPVCWSEWKVAHQLPLDATVAVCVNLADASNLGAVVRSAAALGVAAVLVPAGAGADPWSRKAIRASSGAVFRIPVLECMDLKREITSAAANGAAVIASCLDEEAVPLGQLDLPQGEKYVLLGPEGGGLEAEWTRLSTTRVCIPMVPGVDSLNVAASAAVFFYSLRQTRRKKQTGKGTPG